MQKNRTFCSRPLHLSDFRLLPLGGYSPRPILPDRAGLRLMLDIQEQLRRLAPMGSDERRSIWIEVLRGGPEEWADFDALRADGEVSDEADYLALWRAECPDEVAWFEVSSSSFRDLHYLQVSDGEDALWLFANRDACPPEEPRLPSDVSAFLRPLARYVERTVDAICRDPRRYNRYVARKLPYSKRFGSISRRDLFRILPETRPCLTESEQALLARMQAEGRPRGLAEMTVSRYRQAWQIAYAAVAGPEAEVPACADAGPSGQPDDGHSGFPGLPASGGSCAVGPGAPDGPSACCGLPVSGTSCAVGSGDPDGPEAEAGFLDWAQAQERGHGFDLVYGRLSLRPVCGEDGLWTLVLVFSLEDYAEDAARAAAALSAAGFPVWIHALDLVAEMLAGEDQVEIRPGMTRSGLGAPEMTLPRPCDAETEAQLARLISAADWYPLPEVQPNPFPPGIMDRFS